MHESKKLSLSPENEIGLKPCANGRKVVGQQLPTLLDVTCCVRLHTLLHVVAQSLKPVKLFSQQLPTFLLFRDRQSEAQQCWIRLHSSSNIVRATHAHYAFYKDLWVVSFPRCNAGPNIVGSCCIGLHTTANMHATTPNIVGATMLGGVASVCTQPNGLRTHDPTILEVVVLLPNELSTVRPSFCRGQRIY